MDYVPSIVSNVPISAFIALYTIREENKNVIMYLFIYYQRLATDNIVFSVLDKCTRI